MAVRSMVVVQAPMLYVRLSTLGIAGGRDADCMINRSVYKSRITSGGVAFYKSGRTAGWGGMAFFCPEYAVR